MSRIATYALLYLYIATLIVGTALDTWWEIQ